MSGVESLVVRAVDAGLRPVTLRLPFRFGSITLQACPQLFVRVHCEFPGLAAASGWAAEMLVPKWFDKRAGFSHADNLVHLVQSFERAAAAYVGDTPSSAFGLFERHYAGLMAAGLRSGATALSSAYGQAILDRAVLDALCRARGLSFFDAVRCNLPGLRDSPCMADLHGFDWGAWLRSLTPLRSLAARHTVGMLDALQPVPDDRAGLPVSLPAVIERYGQRYFKIKLGGDPRSDAQRLAEVLAVLERHAPQCLYTLDGNEQYADAAALESLFAQVHDLPAYRRRPEALLYIEQPVARDASLGAHLPWQAAPAPLLMDEADGTLDAFVAGYPLGWHGVSSKSCKGLYKAIINRARCAQWAVDARREGRAPLAFMSAEDLTCQAGVSVQQDLALAALLGLSHCERNGHHYAGGFGGAPRAEQRAFGLAHADLYGGNADAPELRIVNGTMQIGSLFATGFAHQADPDFDTLQALGDAARML
jgi:hypothetical protein